MEHEPRQKEKGSWWLFSAVGIFLLSAGKNVLALLKFSKFGGAFLTMGLSIAAYAWAFTFEFAIGLVAMIFIHEMGHVIAAKQKGLPVTAPLFIPFLGAFISMKRNPRDAVTEAYIAIGGPLVGTLGAMLAYVLAKQTGEPIFYVISYIGFFLNLINLLPIHPLDGGRIATAVTRWLWVFGLIGGLVIIINLRSPIFYIIWALFAWELYQKYIKRQGKGKAFRFSSRFEVPVEPLIIQGIIIPGEEHRRDLPFTTYSNLEGNQHAEVRWVQLGLHGVVKLPQQAIIDKVHVVGIERRERNEGQVLEIRVQFDCTVHESDKYYEVPLVMRWSFGVAYGGLALLLVYMMHTVQTLRESGVF